MFVVQEFVAPGERGVLLFGVIRLKLPLRAKLPHSSNHIMACIKETTPITKWPPQAKKGYHQQRTAPHEMAAINKYGTSVTASKP
jgi:hypothetical protein